MRRSYPSGAQKREAKKSKDEGEKEVISKTKPISVFFSDVNASNDELSTSSPTSATSSQSYPSSSCQAPENSQFQTNDDWQVPTSSLSSSIMPQNNPDSITHPPIDPAQWQLNDSVRNYYTYTTNDLPQNIDKIDLKKTVISSGSQNRCLTKSFFLASCQMASPLSDFGCHLQNQLIQLCALSASYSPKLNRNLPLVSMIGKM